MARSTTAASPCTTSSGGMESPYDVRIRSAITETVRVRVAPSPRRYPRFAVERPQVRGAELRVSGLTRRPRPAAPPERAARLAVSTATRGAGRIGLYRFDTLACLVPSSKEAPLTYRHADGAPAGGMK